MNYYTNWDGKKILIDYDNLVNDPKVEIDRLYDLSILKNINILDNLDHHKDKVLNFKKRTNGKDHSSTDGKNKGYVRSRCQEELSFFRTYVQKMKLFYHTIILQNRNYVS